MSRPVLPREPSEHLVTLSRMLRQVEIDEQLTARRRKRISGLLSELMGEFQKEVSATNGEARSA